MFDLGDEDRAESKESRSNTGEEQLVRMIGEFKNKSLTLSPSEPTPLSHESSR